MERFSFPVGVRWKCVGIGLSWPAGTTTIYLEWENGVEASFTTIHPDAEAFGNEWQQSEDEEDWSDSELPDWLISGDWTR